MTLQLREHLRAQPLSAFYDLGDRQFGVMGWTSRFPAIMDRKLQEENMSLDLLAIDLGKRSFHIHGIDGDGVIVSRKVSRAKLCETIVSLAPMTVAMEACASAHYWGRRFLAEGRAVRLINRRRFMRPRYVRRCASFLSNPSTNKICNRCIA
jgi:hypothetical protein